MNCDAGYPHDSRIFPFFKASTLLKKKSKSALEEAFFKGNALFTKEKLLKWEMGK